MEFNFPNAQYILDTFVGSLVAVAAESNILLGQNHEPLHKGRWKVVSPIDSILSKIHQARVHVSSDSVLCVGTQAMSDATGKFTIWKDHQRNGGTTISKGIISKFLDCEFHVNPGETSMQLMETKEGTRLLDEQLHRKTVYSRDENLPHDERVGGFGQTSSKGRTKPPGHRNHQRSCRTLQGRMLGPRRCRYRKHLEIRQVRDGNSKRKLGPQSVPDECNLLRILTPNDAGNNDLRAGHPQNESRKRQHPLQRAKCPLA